MKLSRRECLGIGAATLAASGCSRIANRFGNSDPALPLPTGPVDATARLINRSSFGTRPGDVARVKAMGHEAYVDQQLAANEPEDYRLLLQLERFDTEHMTGMELRDIPEPEMLRQIQATALLHATYGRNTLYERMADLWTNHLNVYARKDLGAYRKTGDQKTVVRQHALGKFPDMIKASAHSVAMLDYLDNPLNVHGIANENYARELMELHTLGVHGGYTQKDVQEVARCFTGWTFERRPAISQVTDWIGDRTKIQPYGTFKYRDERHDKGEKVVLGHRIPAGGGQEDGEFVLDILAKHPNTAKFIAFKICRELLGDDGHLWESRTADTYLKSGGDIREMIRPVLLSKELSNSTAILKRPLDFMVSALRATDADTDGGVDLQNHLEKMGQPLFQWPMPDGFPVKVSSWTGALLARWNFAYSLANDRLHGTNPKKLSGDAFEAVFSRHQAGEDGVMRDVLAGKTAEAAMALCIASPEFQWR